MNIPVLNPLLMLFKLMFMNSKDLREIKKHEINATLIVNAVIIVFSLIWFLYNSDLVSGLILFSLVIAYSLSTILVLNRLLKDTNIKFDIPSCEKNLCSMLKEIYPHARGYISRHFSILYDSHEMFANDISKIEGIQTTGLTDITQDAAESVRGRFLCVLSDSRYYPTNLTKLSDSQEANELIAYFIRFKKYTINNHITRIFTWNLEDTIHSKQIFLQYLLTNYIAGMDTYILFSKKITSTGLNSGTSSKYFPYIDYVISDTLNTTGCRKMKVYFSYDVSEQDSDQVIVSDDNFLLHLLETDFVNRLTMEQGKKKPDHCTRLSKKNFRGILEDIGLISSDEKENKANINGIIDELCALIQHSVSTDTADSTLKQQLLSELNAWKI